VTWTGARPTISRSDRTRCDRFKDRFYRHGHGVSRVTGWSPRYLLHSEAKYRSGYIPELYPDVGGSLQHVRLVRAIGIIAISLLSFSRSRHVSFSLICDHDLFTAMEWSPIPIGYFLRAKREAVHDAGGCSIATRLQAGSLARVMRMWGLSEGSPFSVPDFFFFLLGFFFFDDGASRGQRFFPVGGGCRWQKCGRPTGGEFGRQGPLFHTFAASRWRWPRPMLLLESSRGRPAGQ